MTKKLSRLTVYNLRGRRRKVYRYRWWTVPLKAGKRWPSPRVIKTTERPWWDKEG